MNLKLKDIPRKYRCGLQNQIEVSDYGEIFPEPNEQLAFVTKSGKKYDIAAKSWGFYATPSVNSRLTKEGFKTAIVKNSQDRYYIMIVEEDKMNEFHAYLDEEKQEVIEWLDERN